MRSSMDTLLTVGAIGAVLVWMAWSLFSIFPKDDAVKNRVTELTPVNERSSIDVHVLEKGVIQDIGSWRVFGPRPVAANAGTLNRNNPFEGI